MTYDEAINEMEGGARIARRGWADPNARVFLRGREPVRSFNVDESRALPWFSQMRDEQATDWYVVTAKADAEKVEVKLAKKKPEPEDIEVDDPRIPKNEDDIIDAGNTPVSAGMIISVVLVICMVLALTGRFVDKSHPFIDHMRAMIAHMQFHKDEPVATKPVATKPKEK